jgi:hypothetical protein
MTDRFALLRVAADCSAAPRPAGIRWRTPLNIAAFTLAALGTVAQTPNRELLNSERIAAEFGSYGIEVLEQTEASRVSNLYSGAGDEKICRTFAAVRFQRMMDPEISAEHAAIVGGGSIGAVFVAAGWEVRKTHLRYSETWAPPRLAALMRIPGRTPLATHIYALDVAKGGQVIEYATLVEIHHPDYLTREDLPAIYGPAYEAPRSARSVAAFIVAEEWWEREP